MVKFQIELIEILIHIKDTYAIIDLYDRIGNKIGETLIDLEDIPKVKSIGWLQISVIHDIVSAIREYYYTVY